MASQITVFLQSNTNNFLLSCAGGVQAPGDAQGLTRYRHLLQTRRKSFPPTWKKLRNELNLFYKMTIMKTFLLLEPISFPGFGSSRLGPCCSTSMRCSRKDRTPDRGIFKGTNYSNAKKAPFGSFLLFSVALTSNLWWLPQAATPAHQTWALVLQPPHPTGTGKPGKPGKPRVLEPQGPAQHQRQLKGAQTNFGSGTRCCSWLRNGHGGPPRLLEPRLCHQQ